MGAALKNKFLVIKIVSGNMFFVFEGQDSDWIRVENFQNW